MRRGGWRAWTGQSPENAARRELGLRRSTVLLQILRRITEKEVRRQSENHKCGYLMGGKNEVKRRKKMARWAVRAPGADPV